MHPAQDYTLDTSWLMYTTTEQPRQHIESMKHGPESNPKSRAHTAWRRVRLLAQLYCDAARICSRA